MSKSIIFRNIATDGGRELPLLRRVIESGEEFEVTPVQAVELYPQPDVWELVSGLDLFDKLLPVPKFAEGGVIPAGTVVLIGEGPETVIPLTETKEGK